MTNKNDTFSGWIQEKSAEKMSRRNFLKYGLGGLTTLAIGSHLSWLTKEEEVYAAVQGLHITITDAVKEMVTHNAINNAECYFWVYQMKADGVDIPVDCPGPIIVATTGDVIKLTITNALDEPHSLFIPGIFDSGPINPGKSVVRIIGLRTAGTFLYYDNLNSPVNRVMGLHGALIVMPKNPVPGHKFTPYDNPTPAVQKLYDDFGSSDHFPGLAWGEGDPSTHTPAFRQYVWLTHQASPELFKEVGSLPTGHIYPAGQFVNAFTKDTFVPNGKNRLPQFFTINGQSGHFSHDNPYITPMGRVGEPVLVRILNAGLWTHSMHLHANHFYVTSINNHVQPNLLWLDTFNVHPLDHVDYTIPFHRPPDIPNQRGIGFADPPLTSINGTPTYPPAEEFDLFFPKIGEDIAQDIHGNPIDLAVRQSPLCYPMHDHSEPTQTAQGGNYNCGLIAGIYFVGDRTIPGQMDFPMEEDFEMMVMNIRGISSTVQAAPPPMHGLYEDPGYTGDTGGNQDNDNDTGGHHGH